VHTQDKVSRALRDMASREIGIDIEEISKLSAEIGIKEVDFPVQPPNRVSNSVILQGSPRTATKNFFLIPDGGGSTTSYTGIPVISRIFASLDCTPPS
jgi:hypothetical protein